MTEDEIVAALVAKGWPTEGLAPETLSLLKILVISEDEIKNGRTTPLHLVADRIKLKRTASR